MTRSRSSEEFIGYLQELLLRTAGGEIEIAEFEHELTVTNRHRLTVNFHFRPAPPSSGVSVQQAKAQIDKIIKDTYGI